MLNISGMDLLKPIYNQLFNCSQASIHTLWSCVDLPQVDSLVIPELPMCHVAMVTDDLTHMLRGHVLLLCLHKPKLAFLTISLGLQLLPFASYTSRWASIREKCDLAPINITILEAAIYL